MVNKSMFHPKKGDISLTTIIVAAIGLIVLIVLIAIFTGRINIFGKEYNSNVESAQKRVCNTQQGYCAVACGTAGNVLPATAGIWTDCGAQEFCCKY